MEPEGSLSS